ncbi:hypothetical protein SH668x_001747 [Planctomicrobium sp. SH668]|uniref:hypothetical protein n=1 Tax=Planctomicrobium sp. SH668 TaxID=3448126 RepID=UPI003F5C0B23
MRTHQQTPQESGKQTRTGIVPLEMVMCLTVLVPLLMFIIFLGTFWSNQALLVATVRNDAWRARYQEANDAEFNFQKPPTPIRKNRSHTVQSVPFLREYAKPRSSHIIFGDAWHARTNDPAPGPSKRFKEFNNHWNLEPSVKLAGFAGVNNLGSLTDMLGKIGDFGNLLRSTVNSILSSGTGIEGLVDQFKQQAESAIEEGKQKLEEAKKEVEEKIQQTKDLIEQNLTTIADEKTRIEDIIKMQDEIAEKLKDETLTDEQKEDLEKESEVLDEEKEKAEDKVKQLEQRNRDLEDLSERLGRALNN